MKRIDSDFPETLPVSIRLTQPELNVLDRRAIAAKRSRADEIRVALGLDPKWSEAVVTERSRLLKRRGGTRRRNLV